MTNVQILREALNKLFQECKLAGFGTAKDYGWPIVMENAEKVLAATASPVEQQEPAEYSPKFCYETCYERCEDCPDAAPQPAAQSVPSQASDSDSTDAARWISVGAGPIPPSKPLLVSVVGGRVLHGIFYYSEAYGWMIDDETLKVTHWRPLPAPPIAATKKESP